MNPNQRWENDQRKRKIKDSVPERLVKKRKSMGMLLQVRDEIERLLERRES